MGRRRPALGRARRDREARRVALHGDLRGLRRARRRADRPTGGRAGAHGGARRHLDLLPARRQRRLRRGRSAGHLPRAPGGTRDPGRHRRHGGPARRAGRPHDVRDLSGRLGPGHEHAVPLDQAGRAPRGHPRRHDRAVGQRDRRPRRGAPPVAPRHRRPADDPGGDRARGAGDVRRRHPAARRGHQPALHLRRRRRGGPSHDAVLRDDRQPRRPSRGLDRGDPPRRSLGDGRRRSPGPFDEDVWELYEHAADWSQARDVAAEHPEKLRELQADLPARGRAASTCCRSTTG